MSLPRAGMGNRTTAGMLIILWVGIGLLSGCGRDAPPQSWWSRVTGFPGDSLGFEDRWETHGLGPAQLWLTTHIRSANLARMDTAPSGGSYTVVYNNGHTVRLKPEPVMEVSVDRTLLLTYLLPYLGRERLAPILEQMGIDTTVVEFDIAWEDYLCMRIGGGEDPAAASGEWLQTGGGRAGVPDPKAARSAIYFDQDTGAVLRLITVADTPIGPRVGEFRLKGHEQRGGAYLPTALETYGAKGLRSALRRVGAEDHVRHPEQMFAIPRGALGPS